MATAPAQIDETDDERRTDPDSDRLREVHEKALERFNVTVLPQQEQRALALAARRFASIPGAQWEDDWGETWANSIKVEINKVSRGVDKIVRDYRANRIVPDFRPAGTEADQETADTLDGMHRADSYHFKSQQARDNAFEEAASGGFGAYRLTTAYADPLNKDSDEQRINPAMTIVDADQRVFFDPNSKLYDKSDARFAFVLTAYSPDAFKEEFGEECATSWPEDRLIYNWDWFRPEVIIVAEYYVVEDRDEQLLIFTHALTGEEQRWWSSDITSEEVSDLTKMGWQKRSSRRKRRRIHKYTMSGAEVLKDNGFIAGSCIPVVPVYGKRWFIDNQERFKGYVQEKMDQQRVYNSNVSKLVETNALSPREKPIFAAEQMPPHLAALWAEQEINRHPYALVEALRDGDGNILASGPIGKIEPPQLPPVQAALLQIANTDLTEDMADPDEVVANTSGEAMDIAATRVDAKSAIYLDNMGQSVQREGEIYLSMCSDVYYEPGRAVETMSEDGDDGEAMLQQAQTGKDGQFRIVNDFTRGRYKVIVSVTEATTTRRDKTVKSMLNIADVSIKAQDQEGAQAALITAAANLDGEGLEDFQRWNRRRALQLGLVEPNEEEQKEMEEAAANAQPDPAQEVLAAQAGALVAQAQKDVKLADKAEADTALSEAKVIETMANAAVKRADAATRRYEAMKPEPANDTMARPRIRMGRDLGA